MTKKNRKKSADEEIHFGNEKLKRAKILNREGQYADSISRSYYACFHFARSALFLLGLEAKSHEGTLRLFSLHFVKTEKVPKKAGRLLSRLFKYRQDADYFFECVFEKSDAVEAIRDAEEFLAWIIEIKD